MKGRTRQPGGPRGARRSGRSGAAHRGPAKERRSAADAPIRRASILIDRIGREGDGLGREVSPEEVSTEGVGEPSATSSRDGFVAVPFTLPGERIDVDMRGMRATGHAIADASPERVSPLCRHHGRVHGRDEELAPACGACAMQHWDHEAYAAWKRGLLVTALQRTGIEAPVDPLVVCAPGTRRRLVLAARRTEAGVLLGFNALRSDRIVDMVECPVAVPEIVAALPTLRSLVGSLLPRGGRARVTVLSTPAGLDVALAGADGAITLSGPIAAPGEPVARLSLDGEVVHERASPTLSFGEVQVVPPPGGFVQAVEHAEIAMAALVTDHLRPARHVADLFSGSGTFALRLARYAGVHAVEGSAEALAALDRGWRGAHDLRRVTTERRDLDRRPLNVAELEGRDRRGAKPFDGLVFDPPRSGAEAQASQIARADVARVAAVSCNPVTLARDLAILARGGYRVLRVVPIDQFVFTPHLEAVALLERGAR